MHRRARALLRDDDEARDVMQEAFTRLVAHHDRLRGDVPVLHWLYRVTTNLSLKRIRQRRTHPVVSDPSAVERIARGDEASQVDRAAVVDLLTRLDETSARIAVYYYLDRMTMDEVADVMGRSRKTVSRHLARIRERARRMLS